MMRQTAFGVKVGLKFESEQVPEVILFHQRSQLNNGDSCCERQQKHLPDASSGDSVRSVQLQRVM